MDLRDLLETKPGQPQKKALPQRPLSLPTMKKATAVSGYIALSPSTTKFWSSPDTDTYHIGLPVLAAAEESKDVLVQLSLKMDKKEYIQMSILLQCLRTDPDLGMVNKDDIASIIQSTYVASGCDFTSFYGCGKASFLSAFYMYPEFITGLDGHGSLSDYINEGGLLAFYRLVGCTYFQKFSSVMPVEYKSPKQLFQSFNEINSPIQRHCVWLDCIRDHSWEKVENEDDVMPSNDALKFH